MSQTLGDSGVFTSAPDDSEGGHAQEHRIGSPPALTFSGCQQSEGSPSAFAGLGWAVAEQRTVAVGIIISSARTW